MIRLSFAGSPSFEDCSGSPAWIRRSRAHHQTGIISAFATVSASGTNTRMLAYPSRQDQVVQETYFQSPNAAWMICLRLATDMGTASRSIGNHAHWSSSSAAP